MIRYNGRKISSGEFDDILDAIDPSVSEVDGGFSNDEDEEVIANSIDKKAEQQSDDEQVHAADEDKPETGTAFQVEWDLYQPPSPIGCEQSSQRIDTADADVDLVPKLPSQAQSPQRKTKRKRNSSLSPSPSTSTTPAPAPSAPTSSSKKTKPVYTFKKIDFEAMQLPCNAGLKNLAGQTPYESFKQFLNDSIFEHIATETTKYAMQKDGVEFPCCAADIEMLFGIILLTGIVRMPQLHLYWSDTFRFPPIADTMSRKKFNMLMKYLHFADNNDMKEPGSSGYDKCHKVRPLLSHLKENLNGIACSEHNSVNEQIIPYWGRSELKQYVPNKPHKWGIKVFTRAGADGFMHDFEIYTGRDTCPDEGLGISGDIVLHLCKKIPSNANYKVFADNFFTSIALATALRKRGIYMVGTIRSNRMGGCQLKTEKELKKEGRGSFDAATEMKTGVNLIRWMDNKAINFISTYSSIEPKGKALRWNAVARKKTEIERPHVVGEYDRFMGGVDLADMLLQMCRVDRKSCKWYFRIVYWVLGVTVANAWLLTRKESNKSLLQFQGDVAHALLKANKVGCSGAEKQNEKPKCSRRLLPCADVRYDQLGHWPTYIKENRCVLCKKNTHNTCLKCKVQLCFTRERNCFYNFHNLPLK